MAELTLKRVKVHLISGSFFYDQYLVFKLEYLLSYLLIFFKIDHPKIIFFGQATS